MELCVLILTGICSVMCIALVGGVLICVCLEECSDKDQTAKVYNDEQSPLLYPFANDHVSSTTPSSKDVEVIAEPMLLIMKHPFNPVGLGK
uniref:Secreted protein n=1 Tax=Steinernema glaseri TaxID=37863 RepID=A0A1I7ZUD6_9BILA